jgi:hypothetical protein
MGVLGKYSTFLIPANINIGVTAWARSGTGQVVTISVDDVEKIKFTGTSSKNEMIGNTVLNSGKGKVGVLVQAATYNNPDNIKSDIVWNWIVLEDQLNFVMSVADDAVSPDADANDAAVLLNWPVG